MGVEFVRKSKRGLNNRLFDEQRRCELCIVPIVGLTVVVAL